MTKKQRQESDALGTIRNNQQTVDGFRLRSLETVALSRADENIEMSPRVLELGVFREWCIICERGVEEKGIIFCGDKKPECIAREKGR